MRALPALADRIDVGRLRLGPVVLGMVGSPAVVVEAHDAGVNSFFVSADLHWPAYEATRRGLALLLERPGARQDLVVCGAVYATQPVFQAAALGELVESVPGLGHLDVSVLGGTYAVDLVPRLAVHRDLRRAGALGIGAVAAAFHDRRAAALALRGGLVDLGFVRYNALHRGAEAEVFAALPSGAAPVYAFKSTTGWVPPSRFPALGLGPGLWRPTPADHYRYVLGQPGVAGALVALRTVGELSDLVAALGEGALSEAERDYVADLAALGAGWAGLAT